LYYRFNNKVTGAPRCRNERTGLCTLALLHPNFPSYKDMQALYENRMATGEIEELSMVMSIELL
jgi:hypothetical protein